MPSESSGRAEGGFSLFPARVPIIRARSFEFTVVWQVPAVHTASDDLTPMAAIRQGTAGRRDQDAAQ